MKKTKTETNTKTSSSARAAEDVRREVRAAYTRALDSRAGGGGCCGGAPPGAAAETVGLAGYGAEVDDFQDAGGASFGCGNPLAFAAVQPGQTVLDLGSGAGLDLLIAARKVGPTGRVIGVDMTDAMLEAARRNAEQAGLAGVIELRRGVIEALPVADASVDWVISNCVINLSPDKPRVFAELARVLRPGGRFAISDIVAQGLPPAIAQLAAAYTACVGGAISEADYVAGLERAGLAEVAVTDRLVYTAAQLRALVESDVGAIAADVPDEVFGAVAGKVWSAKISGRRPA